MFYNVFILLVILSFHFISVGRVTWQTVGQCAIVDTAKLHVRSHRHRMNRGGGGVSKEVHFSVRSYDTLPTGRYLIEAELARAGLHAKTILKRCQLYFK